MAYGRPIIPGPSNKTLVGGANAGSRAGRPPPPASFWSGRRNPGADQNWALNTYYGGNTQPQSPGMAGQGGAVSSLPPDNAGMTSPRMSPYSAVGRPGTPASSARTGFGNGLGYGLGTDEQESPNSQYNRGMGAYISQGMGNGGMNASGAFGNGGWSQNDQGQWSMNTGGANVMGGRAQGQIQHGLRDPMGSVNYGAVAGLQNYLSMLPASQQGAAAQQLRQQGLLGTVNGYAFGQAPMNNTLSPVSAGATTGNWNMPGGNPAGYFAANGDYINGGVNTGSGAAALPAGVHQLYDGRGNVSYVHNPSGGAGRTSWVPYTGDLGGGGVYDSGGGILGGQGAAAGQYGAGGFGGQTVGGSSGGASAQGYPLQPAMQSAISGILSNPSPYSQQQQSMLRNQATLGVEQQGRTAQQNAAEDAVRRGLNPAEAQANQFAIQGQMNAQRQGALNTFELNNAQATRQGLMGGLQAGMGFTSQQMQEEDSVRRYLAMLASAQGGNPPTFLNL